MSFIPWFPEASFFLNEDKLLVGLVSVHQELTPIVKELQCPSIISPMLID